MDAESQRLYSSTAWRKMKARHLKNNYLCVYCRAAGKVNANNLIVDHIQPHRGNTHLFYDMNNVQTLCKECHDSIKTFADAYGYDRRIGADGWPIDPNHPAHTGEARAKSLFHRGVPIGVQERTHPTYLVCGPPGGGRRWYVDEHKGADALMLDPDITAGRLKIDKRVTHTRYSRRQIAEAEVLQLRRHEGEAWIIREAPKRETRGAWMQALGPQASVVLCVPSEQECYANLRTQGRDTPTLRGMVRAWFDVYRRR